RGRAGHAGRGTGQPRGGGGRTLGQAQSGGGSVPPPANAGRTRPRTQRRARCAGRSAARPEGPCTPIGHRPRPLPPRPAFRGATGPMLRGETADGKAGRLMRRPSTLWLLARYALPPATIVL